MRLALVLLACCASSTPEPTTVATMATETPMTITLRYELESHTIAHEDASTNIAARLSGTIYARHDSDAALELEFQAFAAHQLDWTLTRSDGVVFLPVFLPPPMPPPNGIPRRSARIAPRSEGAVTSLYGGISGFYEQSRGQSSWGPLPVGEYEIIIGNIELGTGPLTTEPFALVVE